MKTESPFRTISWMYTYRTTKVPVRLQKGKSGPKAAGSFKIMAIKHDAYEVIREEYINDISSQGYVLRHKKSGAVIALISNDDDNKVFYIGFRTPPADSTGVAHIIEHSTLCGSEKYPVKDPFVELVKGSLNTFLNAMTYPDKTVYPIASCNDQDFKNLMDVYMDAVFAPNIYREKKIFMQEGWHYEMQDKDDELAINGVVYNEMKGAFSSPDSVMDREILNSLFPDTPYGVESGGDPDNIPDLTYENFLDFHRKYYHPSNSYIYLYGDMDMEERLDYLDREYLSKYDAITVDSEIPKQKPFESIRVYDKEYPVAQGEDTEDAAYLSWNVVMGTTLDPVLYQAFDILDYALLNSPGAPIKKALIHAGIGKDILGGYDSTSFQPVFSVVAKGANKEDQDKFLSIIRETLEEQVANGIDKKSLYAAINSSQFSYREADFGQWPKGLMYGLQILDSWLYSDTEPFMHLNGIQVLDGLKEKVETGYFEELVKTYMLDNTHASSVTMVPSQGLLTRKDDELRGKLAEMKAGLSEEEIDEIVENTKALKAYQDEPSPQEDLEKIPMLKRSDMRREIRPLDLDVKKAGEHDVVWSNVNTNGISYLTLVFDAGRVPEEDIPYFNFMGRLMGLVDTASYTYADLANEVNLKTGGISVNASSYSLEDDDFKVTLEARIKFLLSEKEQAMHLYEEVLTGSSFADGTRIRELLDQELSRMEAKLSSSGHTVAAARAVSYFRPSGKVSDLMSGIGYYRFIKDLSKSLEKNEDAMTKLQEHLNAILHAVVRSENMTAAIIGEQDALDHASDYVKELSDRLFTDEIRLAEVKEIVCEPAKEAFTSASQVQYVCRAGSYAKAGFEFNGAMNIAKTILGYDYFWINIRVKGGAYGCMSAFNRTGDLAFMSYRDPNLTETNDVFEATPEYLENFDASERDMTKYVIGTLSGMDTPLTPSMRGTRALTAYITGITEEMLQKQRNEVIDAKASDIRALAEPVRKAMEQDYLCVVGNEDVIAKHRDMFDKVENLL